MTIPLQRISRSLLGELTRRAAPVGRDLIDAILPQDCTACHAPIDTAQNAGDSNHGPSLFEPSLCRACDALVAPLLNLTYCPRCARTVQPHSIHENKYCAWCSRESQWNIAGIARIGPYASPLREMLCSLKFGGNQRAADWIAGRLAQALRNRPWFSRVEMLVPVPMHWMRRLQRPCAHARVLAEALGARLHLPVRSWVWRWKYAPSQMAITTRSARLENVADCFGPSPWALHHVQGRRVCIVDNLVVSAGTIYEVSKVLRRLGAKEIFTAIACRATTIGGFQAKPETVEVQEKPLNGSIDRSSSQS